VGVDDSLCLCRFGIGDACSTLEFLHNQLQTLILFFDAFFANRSWSLQHGFASVERDNISPQ